MGSAIVTTPFRTVAMLKVCKLLTGFVVRVGPIEAAPSVRDEISRHQSSILQVTHINN
jgi:hypothetical protein